MLTSDSETYAPGALTRMWKYTALYNCPSLAILVLRNLQLQERCARSVGSTCLKMWWRISFGSAIKFAIVGGEASN